jgi:hypothetical protein
MWAKYFEENFKIRWTRDIKQILFDDWLS